MNLEELIYDMVQRGQLTHLSLSPVQDGVSVGGGKTLKNMWAASFCAATPIGGYTFVLDMDPVEALRRAITEAKLKRRKTKEVAE